MLNLRVVRRVLILLIAVLLFLNGAILLSARGNKYPPNPPKYLLKAYTLTDDGANKILDEIKGEGYSVGVRKAIFEKSEFKGFTVAQQSQDESSRQNPTEIAEALKKDGYDVTVVPAQEQKPPEVRLNKTFLKAEEAKNAAREIGQKYGYLFEVRETYSKISQGAICIVFTNLDLKAANKLKSKLEGNVEKIDIEKY